MLENVKLYEQAKDLPFSNKQIDLIGQILRNAANQVYTINIASPPPTVFVVDENIRNIPEVAVSTWTFQSPGNAGMETYYFDNAIFDEDVAELIQNELSNFTGQPAHNSESISTEVDNGWSFSSLISWLTILIIFIILGIASLKHAFVLKRIMLCIPTLLVISILIFTIIKLPPGDFLSSKIIQLELLGDTASITELNYLKEQYNLNKSSVYQYLHWMGFHWFVTFSAEDKGIMQGFLGYSMEFSSSVNAILSDDILFFTVALSLLSMFVTWGVALPLGIYSAVRQYSNSDWVISFITFISMSIPSFILSIFVLFIANILFDIQISGLLSPEYEDQPGWNWHKFIDLLKNLAIPTFISALSSIGNMIRIMRGSLLDELKQPYVKSAIARGVHPVKGLFKYPVRVALNPFVSSIGGLLPQIISGGTIIAVILSLPTVGPLLLNSLQNEDMYLAGSLLLLLSFFSVIGTLISDILLVYLDPRIRYESKNGG